MVIPKAFGMLDSLMVALDTQVSLVSLLEEQKKNLSSGVRFFWSNL
jgi:hypothetical protein